MSRPQKSFVGDSPFAFVVVPLSITAVTAAVLFAFGYAMVSPYLSMLRWFSDRTEEYQSQDLLSQASSVLDGSADADRRLKNMLFWDVNNGISRRSWARNEGAVFAIKRAMEANPNLKVTLPNYADDQLVESLF